ncbi:MAG: SDR family oxidoreductase [Bacteroidota bacterium]
MKILVTGSNGLLGQKLVYLLRGKQEVQLIATSRGENRIKEKAGYEYFPLDITDKGQVKKACDKYSPDVIINTAAMTNVDECEVKKEECFKQNVTAVQNLVDCITQNETRNPKPETHLIHLSTDFVFDGENGPYKEEDKPNPLSYYAWSKNEAEKIIRSSNIQWAIARTIIVYGVTDFMSRTNIVLWAKSALEKGEPLKIVNDQWRMPTLAEDLAEGCWLIAKKGATGIFNLSGKDFMSIIELVYRVADFYGYDKSIITPVSSSTLNQAAKRPPKTGFVLDKSIRQLGYNPHSFEEGLKIIDDQLKTNK